MGNLVLAVFCAGLVFCGISGVSILYALVAGLLLFWGYGRMHGASWRELARMSWEGVRTVRNILISFLLIGMMTALWRAAGTIPVIVCYAGQFVRPEIFLLLTFLLNCGVSVLTGTSFGTAATMGVICMSIAETFGLDPMWTGGAILSGVYFGDRCSQVSTSALLVAELTETDIFGNIRRMIRSCIVPFVVSAVIYLVLGLCADCAGTPPDLEVLFGGSFVLHPAALLPAAVILVLSAFRVRVKTAMSVSIVTAAVVCLTVQQIPAGALLRMLFWGYQAADPAVAAMLDGGGIVSMLRVSAIICISSAYSGLFSGTGLLDRMQERLGALAARTTPSVAVLCTAAVTAVVSCNQTLTILLAHQLCGGFSRSREELALDLEDMAVVIPPLVPWSIAGAVPLTSVGAPTASILLACYLYLLPLWRAVVSLRRQKTS